MTLGPPRPAAEFGDGLYLAGTDIIANNISAGPSRVTAVQGEYLEISGCTFVTA